MAITWSSEHAREEAGVGADGGCRRVVRFAESTGFSRSRSAEWGSFSAGVVKQGVHRGVAVQQVTIAPPQLSRWQRWNVRRRASYRFAFHQLRPGAVGSDVVMLSGIAGLIVGALVGGLLGELVSVDSLWSGLVVPMVVGMVLGLAVMPVIDLLCRRDSEAWDQAVSLTVFDGTDYVEPEKREAFDRLVDSLDELDCQRKSLDAAAYRDRWQQIYDQARQNAQTY